MNDLSSNHYSRIAKTTRTYYSRPPPEEILQYSSILTNTVTFVAHFIFVDLFCQKARGQRRAVRTTDSQSCGWGGAGGVAESLK